MASISDLGKDWEDPKPMNIDPAKQNAPSPSDNKYKEVDISAFVKPKPKELSPIEKFERKEIDLIDKGIERTKKELEENVLNPIKEKCIEISLREEADQIASENSDLGKSDDMEEIMRENDERMEQEMKSKSESNGTSIEDDFKDFLSQDSDDEGEDIIMEDIIKPDTFMEDPEDIIPTSQVDEDSNKETPSTMEEKEEVKNAIIGEPDEEQPSLSDTKEKNEAAVPDEVKKIAQEQIDQFQEINTIEETKEEKKKDTEENIFAAKLEEKKQEDKKENDATPAKATPAEMVTSQPEITKDIATHTPPSVAIEHAPASKVTDDKPKASNTIEEISDADLQEFLNTASDAEEAETEEDKARVKKYAEEYKKDVFAKLNAPAVLDSTSLKKYRIAQKPVSINKILRTANTINKSKTASWPLPNTGRLITFSGLSGEEIENFNPEAHDENMSTDMANRLIFNTFFEHLVDPNKPATMEEWLQTINWFDSYDLYFAQYLGTFKNSNYVTYGCTNTKCGNIWLIPIKPSEQVKYADDDAKAVYQNLMKTAIDVTPETIESTIIPVNNTFAVGFRAPSIYDIVFGTSTLNQNFIEKYATTIGNIAYISDIYYINGETLFKVDTKPVKDDLAKTARNKIVAYYNILKTLTPDEYSIVTRAISNINEKNRRMATFEYPDVTCPRCGTKVEGLKQQNPLSMLFTRHQLAQFASTMTV